ncbi:uncharacterized protein AKAME5_000390200 [Lates japonicus]|uniref:Rho GTPase-activating protein 30-like n=1 Tax=Lates japonicus TaxID=270547 RepID=A0AAD3MB93_LATJO|nr:uncharacterized protein AKAME5_000390200 [Lates japonicus]
MRRVRRRGGNKEKVFGCDLLEHLTASCQEVPQVLRCCSEFVEHHGIVDGIYRLSGVSSNIQKLRGEFESDGNPDLNKDVYLQDIHCVSSLCKAYFRELPNPLLTYQLYDKFAEAVAIQLEEERLVKIRDVLKELPTQHYRTLEFLMRHLVRMASYSSETNMHARNLAIVWAPNLLRSKDIEATGFNGTAAFMEVRVQSIVVEFILTHVPQLFPEQDVSGERRKSLPSPCAASSQDEAFFKSVPNQPVTNFGNISPGDGPLRIRPYHAIIEGTDKRKGSLKGRKWMSIFNIGGRFPDPRRRHKHSAKEKDTCSLRPARSMDSLSNPSYPNEGSRHPGHRPPSTNMSPIIIPAPQSSPEVAASPGALGGSEYAVTYRRGTGLVSGGAGTQGTYTALDPEGLGVIGNEVLQSRSPGLSTKAGRRAAMHITGPTMVTVPLHITSNLALGVLQGGGSDRIIHRGRDKDGGDRVEGKEEGDRVERKEESREMEMKVKESRKVKETEKDREGVVDVEGNRVVVDGVGKEKGEGAKEEEKKEEEVRDDSGWNPELVMGDQGVPREQRTTSFNSNTDDEDAENNDQYIEDSEYMEMKGVERADPQPGDVSVFDGSDVLNSTEGGADDQELFGYVQDNFEFLDQMDCSVMDHMDCSVSYQVNEFSVEPPGHSDDEYEIMVQAQPPHHPAEQQTHLQPSPEIHTLSQNELNPHRLLSLDLNRHTKSLSLPYMTSPVHGPGESFSEDEDLEDNNNDDDYSCEEDESMMSFPSSFGTQVAAIMDVLAKAAVAEITKLVEDGTVVLRLEMCRKDSEIQELQRGLKRMEAELCKAQEAAMTRATEDRQEHTTAGNHVPPKDETKDQQTSAAYLEAKTADSLCETRRGTEESCDMRPAVKHEPADELSVQETTDNTATAAGNVCFEAGERDDPIWPPAACSMFEKSSTVQQHIQIFPSHAEQFSAHRNTESSYNSSSNTTEEIADDSLNIPIKVEVGIRPMCMGSVASESVHNESFRHVSRPAVSQDQCLRSASQQAGPSLTLPHAQRSTAGTEDHILSRNNLRVKRLMNVWRTNQKLFICSVCNKGFPRLSQLEEHKATHQPFKPFRCLECGKSFTQKTRLKTHQSVHTGERPFSCKICGKMFSRQDNCLRHERFHSGLKPYSCGQCGKSFTVLGNLKIHQEIHLQGR